MALALVSTQSVWKEHTEGKGAMGVCTWKMSQTPSWHVSLMGMRLRFSASQLIAVMVRCPLGSCALLVVSPLLIFCLFFCSCAEELTKTGVPAGKEEL